MAEDELEYEGQEDLDNEEIPYLTYDVMTYPSDLTFQVLLDMWKQGDIFIPEYQRNYVWSQKQASLLIDSFLTGLPVPQLFFYLDSNNQFQVIDGQQRLTSIIYYLEGFFGGERPNGSRKVFRLTGLSDKAPWAGKSFDELDQKQQRKLRSSVIRVMNVQQIQPDNDGSSAYYIFERLNTGGTRLSSQEIRNVVYRGPFNEGLKQLNSDSNWRALLGKPTQDRRQKDTELVLRVFALSFYRDQYEKPLTEFLNKVIEENREATIETAYHFKVAFTRATELACSRFGSRPFHPRGRLNVATLDSVLSVLIGNYDELDIEHLAQNWNRLKQDTKFIDRTTTNTTDEKTVQLRILTVLKYLSKKQYNDDDQEHVSAR
ncbi:DUF262 domain-containing protein [Bifidobacterium asteroides]|uniref:DUF262 domain-containing protein n=1 Tax=Bifidobacterium asteroides TaxID=1684 RepID=UPI003A7FD7E5